MSRSVAGRAPRLVALAVVLLVLAGCVRVPTTGPVQQVEGQQPSCQTCVAVDVAPPQAGANPLQIVQGFLRANASFQPGYAVARQFLTRDVAQTWSTDEGVTIYSGGPVGEGSDIRLRGEFVGSLGKDRSFTPRDTPLDLGLGLVQEGGEWRISRPPPGLLVRDFLFNTFYRPYDLYFVGGSGAGPLVPDPIFLPDLRAPANTASALVKALLEGPTDWLEPAVGTAVPADTTLSVDSVTLSNGLATVPLTGNLLALSDAQRSLLAAQVAYTLAQVVPVKRVQLQVDSQPFRVPQSEGSDLSVGVDAVGTDLDPVPSGVSDQLYAVVGGRLQSAGSVLGGATPAPVAGAFGGGRYDVGAIGVSATNTDVAAVTDGGTVLRRSTLVQDPAVQVVLSGVSGLLRPQFTRGNELWTVGERDGRQRLFRVVGDQQQTLALPFSGDGRVTAFRFSPDGARLAAVVQDGDGTRLGVARVVRRDSAAARVEAWRELDLSTPLNSTELSVFRDVAWRDADELVVLGAQSRRSAYAISQVRVDGSEIETDLQQLPGTPRSLAVALGPQQSVVVLTSDGTVYRDDGSQWQTLFGSVGALAFPG